MYHKSIFALLLALFIQFNANSQTQFLQHEIASTILKEKRAITIYLPPSYTTNTGKSYPVIYVMDGQEYFLQPIAYQQMLRFKDKAPECIVVGVNTDRRKRRPLFYQKADQFIAFLQTELIPHIDTTYRTLKAKERIYFGWEMAGGLSLDIFTHNPTLFSSYLIASPTHLSSKRLDKLSETLHHNHKLRTYFYISRANSRDDAFIEGRFVALKKVLDTCKNSNTKWDFALLDNEGHYSTPTQTLQHGLHNYFKDYQPLRFFSLQEYHDYGGIAALQNYAQHRAERYQVSPEIQRETQHFLIFQALKDNDFKQFNAFIEAFPDYLSGLKNKHWVKRYADYYIKHNQTDQAIALYEQYVEQFNEASLYHDLGNTYLLQGQQSKAKKALKTAVKLGETQNDPNLNVYQESLEKL